MSILISSKSRCQSEKLLRFFKFFVRCVLAGVKLSRVQSIFLSRCTQNRTHMGKAATYCGTNGIENRSKKKFRQVESFKVTYKLVHKVSEEDDSMLLLRLPLWMMGKFFLPLTLVVGFC